jgi:hypothetical protein
MDEIKARFGQRTLDILSSGGYATFDEIAEADEEELSLIDIEQPVAMKLIECARAALGRDWKPRQRKPLSLETYSESWMEQFQSESRALKDSLPKAAVEHIGSTAVVGLDAKPIIDIMVGISTFDDFEDVKQNLISHQYEFESLRES